MVGRVELAGEGNSRLATATARQLDRMARALLEDASQTAYVLFEAVHLSGCRKVKRSD